MTDLAGSGGARLRALDGLRFLAALSVVAFHYTARANPAWGGADVRTVFPTLSRFTAYGGFGPYLFFMISGFVVLMSAWGRSPGSFVASRAARLYPAYWFAVLATAVVLVTHQDLIPVWGSLHGAGAAVNLTMFQSAFGVPHVDGVYWTLWVELKFYGLLALLCLAGATRGRVLLLCLLWPVVGALAAQYHADLLVALLEPSYAPFFCIGLLLFLVHREGWSPVAGLLLAFNVLFGVWLCASFYVPWTLAVAGVVVSVKGVVTVFALMVLALAACTLTPLARIRWRWLTALGALTYPLYLIHEYPGWALIHHLAPALPAHVVLVLVVAVMLLVAFLVHRLVERPLGRRMRTALERELTRPRLRRGTRPRRHEEAATVTRPVAVREPVAHA